jgi:hypothetical protein
MRALLLGAFLGSFGLIGCGPDIRGTCEAQTSCKSGNELDTEACVASSEVLVDLIQDIGCGDEYDAYTACFEPLAQCRSIPTGQMCANDDECGGNRTCSNGECASASYGLSPEDEDKCETETRAYTSCANFN